MKRLIIGLSLDADFVTVGFKEEGKSHVFTLRDSNGRDRIPTVMFNLGGTYSPFFGSEALLCAEGGCDGELVTDILDWSYINGGDLSNRKQYMELFFRYIRKLIIGQTTGISYDEWIVRFNYPSNCSDNFIYLMKDVIRRAGFGSNVDAVSYGFALSYKLLSFNLFDQSKEALEYKHFFIIDYEDDCVEIVIGRFCHGLTQTKVDNLMSYPLCRKSRSKGEREVDKALKNYLITFLNSYIDTDSEIFYDSDLKKWKECHCMVSLNCDVALSLPSVIATYLKALGRRDVINSFHFDRCEFEKITFQHWKNVRGDIMKAMNKYGELYEITSNNIDVVFITGCEECGWYMIRELFTKKLFNEFCFKRIASNSSSLIVDSFHGSIAEVLCKM